jgi:hypothetical protein
MSVEEWPFVTDDPDRHRANEPASGWVVRSVRELTTDQIDALDRGFEEAWADPERRALLVSAWAGPLAGWNRWTNEYSPIGDGLRHEPSERFRDGVVFAITRLRELDLPAPSSEVLSELHSAWTSLAAHPDRGRQPVLDLTVSRDHLGAVLAVASAAVCAGGMAHEAEGVEILRSVVVPGPTKRGGD